MCSLMLHLSGLTFMFSQLMVAPSVLMIMMRSPHLDINGDSQESRLDEAVARNMEEDDVDHARGPPLKKQEPFPQLKY